MTPTKFNAVEDSGKMMRTLCLLFLAVGLSDYNIGDIKSPSMILLAVSMLVIISIQKISPRLVQRHEDDPKE